MRAEIRTSKLVFALVCSLFLKSHPRIGILARNRANRGGLIEAIERRIEETGYFDIKPVDCGGLEFYGAPYREEKECVFGPGREAKTTREYAQVNHAGDIIVHPTYIFPGESGWEGSPWLMRVLDNKFPLVDRIDFFSGLVYDASRRHEGLVEMMEAKGKDFVIVLNPHHIVPAHSIDFVKLAILEKTFAERELEDPDVKYVCIGSNNAGLPQKKFLEQDVAQSLDILLKHINGDDSVSPEVQESVQTLMRYSKGYYKSDGAQSGTSQLHLHGRVISFPLLPPWIKEGYERTEENARQNGANTFLDYCLSHGLLIDKGKYFSMVADPVPEFNGGLLIIANERHNITKMDDGELRELAEMRKAGRVMHEILFSGIPSNDYMIQTFGSMTSEYPNTRFSLALVPRGNVQAFVELGTKIVGLTTDPRSMAEAMIHLKEKYPKYLRAA